MIVIDYKDRRPVYEQIVDRYQELVISGVLPPDTPLPSVRSQAMELSINPNTIQRAYSEMERRGIIYSVKGRGSFISSNEALVEQRKKEILLEIKVLANEAFRLHMEETALKNALHGAFLGVTESEGGKHND